MPTSDKKIAANRRNGQKSRGPANTTSTRYNATKHGLLSEGVTELDDTEGYQILLRDLMEEKKPVGVYEGFLVELTAVDMIRALRARRLEAEFITAKLNPPVLGADPGNLDVFQASVVDPGIPALIDSESAEHLVTYQRYETAFVNRLYRSMHEFERLERTRNGETMPAPATLDVNVVDTRSDAATKYPTFAGTSVQR